MKNLEIENLLKKYNQTNLINMMNEFSEDEEKKIIEQLKNIDLEKITELYNTTKKEINVSTKNIEHIDYIDKSQLTDDEKNKYRTLGEEIIKNNQYAVVTLAGGQGTRLGHSGPKGTFKIKVNGEEKYLFEIIVDSLKQAEKKYNVIIPWYIMASSENEDETKKFLKEHNYFGYPEDNVYFFVQGNLPLVDVNGQLIINQNKLIKEASDGNGSIYNSMKKNKIIEKMKKSGIKWIFVGGVDNILLKIVDPILTGATICQNNLIASKSVVKREPGEKAGVFCKANGKPKVIEYTELPKEMAQRTNEKGELIFGEINILSHLYSIRALEELADVKLPYHIAFKKSNFLDRNQNYIEVKEPNAYKFESFIFDAFENFDNISILRVKREDEFAPIKNATGKDSPQTAIKLYEQYKNK